MNEWIEIKAGLPPDNTKCIAWCKHKNGNEFFVEVLFKSEYIKQYSFEKRQNRFVNYENAGEYQNDYTELVTHYFVPSKPIE